MKLTGVITGDIVNSRELAVGTREKLYFDIEVFLNELKQQKLLNAYELFRGDSFQCIVTEKDKSLNAALMIRAFMKSYVGLDQEEIIAKYKRKEKTASKGYFPGRQDVRLSIGIGSVDFIKKTSLAHSDGEAFKLSGESLDSLKDKSIRMIVKTSDNKFNVAIEPAILLLDAVVRKWTNNQAEVVLLKLKNLSEYEIAKKLIITQSAVSQRTKTSEWFAIEKLLVYFINTLEGWG